MNAKTQPIINSLPAHLSERTRALNKRPVKDDGEFVLYWMHHAVRGHENPALDVAVAVGNQLGLPVLVYQGLGGHHPYNSDRHHTFIMEGARDAQAELVQRGITHWFYLPENPDNPSPLRGLMNRAALILTEDFPAPPFKSWYRYHAEHLSNAFWAIDTACIIPLQMIQKFYPRAFQYRKATWSEYQKRLKLPYKDLSTDIDPFRGPCGFQAIDLASADVAELCAKCAIDHMVGPVAHTRGGATAGYRRWEQYRQHGLRDYAKTRNDAAIAYPEGVSRMSAYLHHGHVSPFRIVRQAAAADADKFLDEILIWRELAHHFCFFHDHPDRIEALPDWAIRTLDAHRQDPRTAVFTWETMARAKTGDPLWDAAQTSLMIHGELHNNIRMTWGKAILQWTGSPEEALRLLIDLNHRYALDGSDPNSYGGILWCLGLFDRPFQPENPVIGTLRPRSTRSHAARLDLNQYAARITRPSGAASLRVAVIGAGISGLVAARSLTDHGHRVRVFEKARGPGGRISTRRTNAGAFDHGAQYFSARDGRFKKWVDSWIENGIVRLWEGRIRVLRQGEVHMERHRHHRYVGVPGMSAIARHLAADMDVRCHHRVERIYREGQALCLANDAGEPLGHYDALIVSAPPEQGARLLDSLTPLAARLKTIFMHPCWAVLLAFAAPLPLPFDGAFIHDADVAWAARNSSKPGRSADECWVLHAGADWSATHLKTEAEAVIQRLTASFFDAAGSPPAEPVFSAAHRWRYARAQHPLEDGCLWDRQAMMGVCGDWCCGSKIEGAFLSGSAMAGRILTHIN